MHAASTTGARSDPEPVPDRLLRAATRLFARGGFPGTSVQQIVTEAQVTKGALYHYFGSKDDVLYAVYHRILAAQTERLERIVSSQATVEERLRAAAVDVVVSSADNMDDLTIFFREMQWLSAEKAAIVRRERRHYHELFRSLLEEGQREGVLRDDASADLAAHAFFGSVHHLFTWFHPDGPMSAAEVGESLADLLVRGLRAGA